MIGHVDRRAECKEGLYENGFKYVREAQIYYK